jgi:hypothetical protein
MASVFNLGGRGGDRRDIVIYERSLGDALRSLGQTDTRITYVDGEIFRGRPLNYDPYNGIPVRVVMNAPARVAAEFERGGLLRQTVLLEILPAMQRHVRAYILPFVTPNAPPNVSALESSLRARQDELLKPIEAAVERHCGNAADWRSYRNANLFNGSLILVQVSLSAAAIAMTPFTGGVSGAAGILGIVRGVIDGFLKLRDCWLTAAQALKEAENEMVRLGAAYDRSVGVGRAMQFAGAVGRGTSLTKLSKLAGVEVAPSFGTIDAKIKMAESKLKHLYTFLARLSEKLEQLLLQQDGIGDAENAKLQQAISALLDSGTTGKLHGFRGSYTIPDGMRQYKRGLGMLDVYKMTLDALRKRDPNARSIETGANITETATNIAMSAINYPALFDKVNAIEPTPGMSAEDIAVAKQAVTTAELFGVGAGQHFTKTVAASFGLFNDASTVLKELAAYYPGGEGDAEQEHQVRLRFNTTPSGIVAAGSTMP